MYFTYSATIQNNIDLIGIDELDLYIEVYSPEIPAPAIAADDLAFVAIEDPDYEKNEQNYHATIKKSLDDCGGDLLNFKGSIQHYEDSQVKYYFRVVRDGHNTTGWSTDAFNSLIQWYCSRKKISYVYLTYVNEDAVYAPFEQEDDFRFNGDGDDFIPDDEAKPYRNEDGPIYLN